MRVFTIIALMAILLAACSKPLPVAEPFDPKRDMEKANAKLEDKYEEEARQIYENIQRLDTTGEYAPLAQLRIADSYLSETMTDLAVSEYRGFLRAYPRHKYASYAQYKIGLIYFSYINGPDRGYGDAIKAIEEFHVLNEDYPRNPYRDDVEVKIMQATTVVAEHEYNVGDFYFKKGACRGAVQRLEGVRRDHPDFTATSSVLYRLALCYEKLGMLSNSTAAIEELGSRFPASGLADKAIEDIEEYREELSGKE